MKMPKLLVHIIREFWLPFIAAIIWTVYVVWGKPVDLKMLITAFTPAFFMISWMTGQFFRIKKQESVQSGLVSVESRVEELVSQLEFQAQEIMYYTTGGCSFCYFSIGVNNNQATWTVIHKGKYPLYNVGVRIVDVAKFEIGIKNGNPSAGDINIHIGDIAQGQAKSILQLDLENGSSQDFNVFFSARNGFFTQFVRFRRVNDNWVKATIVEFIGHNTNPIFERTDENYPCDLNGKPEGI